MYAELLVWRIVPGFLKFVVQMQGPDPVRPDPVIYLCTYLNACMVVIT